MIYYWLANKPGLMFLCNDEKAYQGNKDEGYCPIKVDEEEARNLTLQGFDGEPAPWHVIIDYKCQEVPMWASLTAKQQEIKEEILPQTDQLECIALQLEALYGPKDNPKGPRGRW